MAMSSFLRAALGVAMSGVSWDAGRFTLWQSVRDDIILFTPKQPALAKAANGRYQCGVNVRYQQAPADGGADTYKITGGSAIFTITSAVQTEDRAFEELQEQWRAAVVGSGLALTRNPRFVPLNVRKGEARVLIAEADGRPDVAHNNADAGTPGGTSSFLIRLTEAGAQAWLQGIRSKTAIPAGVKLTYEYLRLMPPVGARVTLHGRRAFSHLSAQRKASYSGVWYGGSAQIDAAWESMVREGAVTVELAGDGLPPEQGQLRQSLASTFAQQVEQAWFKLLFEEKPKIDPAQAGVNFALRWRSESEAVDLTKEIRFEGWTWLRGSMDADLGALFAALDDSYVTEVHSQQSAPASVVVDGYEDLLKSVATSWSAERGKSPEAPVFGPQGGTSSYVVTDRNPDDVLIRLRSRVSFAPPRWPVIEHLQEAKLAEGGNQMVVKASAWVGRHLIFLLVRDGERILSPAELDDDDYLVANVSYQAPYLRAPIKASARITPLEPLEFLYPLDPHGARGTARYSAFGVLDGKLVRAQGEQTISFDEDAVFILAGRDSIQLVGKESVLGESDRLGQRLRASPLAQRLRPGLEDGGALAPSGAARGAEGARCASPPTNGHRATNGYLTGVAVALDYSAYGQALVIDAGGGPLRRVLLPTSELAEALDERRRRVRVKLDESGRYAEQIRVEP
jgi:hypothetical protein